MLLARADFLTDEYDQEIIYLGVFFMPRLKLDTNSVQSRKWTWGKTIYLIVGNFRV